MKPTTMSSKCFSGVRGLSHAGIGRGASHAHTPSRHRTGPLRQLGPAPRLSASGHHLGYVEAPPAAKSGSKDGVRRGLGRPHVLHVDTDSASAFVLAGLLVPEAHVTHAATVAEARRFLEGNVFSLVVLDPAMPDGDARTLLPLLCGTPLLVYSLHQPEWRCTPLAYLPKPWTSTRQLWVAISTLLGLPSNLAAGD
jgi:two-component system phosphate regulon response regulator OmpR